MTRFRMGAPVTAPQDAPGRGSKPAPSTPGEPVLKPNRTTGFPAVEGKPAVYGGRGCHRIVMYERDGGDYSPAVVGLWPQMVERVSVLLEAFKDLVAGVRDKKQLQIQLTQQVPL